ncbi:fibronectin type III domain-containing protein, partial [Flavihumibacter sediminis]|nr:fibronectin type III domain-containing protein [Flavihumibacter sediminis]
MVKVTHVPSGLERISAPFRIMPEINFTVSSTCESSGLLRWTKPAGIDSFAVLKYNGTEMERIGITSDTSYQVDGLSTGKPYWFTVQPILNGLFGERAIAKR